MRLEGKVAFVTGASRGIGAAVARALANEGVSVGLASRSGDDLGLDERARARVRRARRSEQVEDAVAQTVERFGRLDICVANAGVGSYHTLVDTPLEHLEEMIDVNLKGTIYAARAAHPAPDRERRGRPRHGRVGGRPAAVFRAKPSTARRSSARSASRARSTTSCASTASAAPTSARAASRRTSRSRRATAERPTCSRG